MKMLNIRQLLSVLLLLIIGASAVSAEKITSYRVDVTIEQSGELAITETISYDFEGAMRHGIYRDIPYQIKVKNRTKNIELNNFSVTMDGNTIPWEKSTQSSTHAGKVIRLKIGSPHTKITGLHHYTITYRSRIGVLPSAQNSAQDAVRWNAIGTGWRVPIENVEVNLHLPASLQQHDIALSAYTGKYGTRSSKANSHWVNSQHLAVQTSHLAPHEGLTVELAFPANRLDQNGQENAKVSLVEKIIGSWHWAALIGVFLFFYRKLKEYTGFIDKRAIAVQYQAPDDLSLLESGLLLDKHTDEKDFAAAVLELAHLGYIEITKKSDSANPLLKRTGKKIVGLTMDQVYLLNQVLFKKKDSFEVSGGSKTKASGLQKGFDQINKNLYSWSVAEGCMTENPNRVRAKFLKTALFALIPLLLLTLLTLAVTLDGEVVFLLLFGSVFVGAGAFVALNGGWFNKIFGLIFGAVGGCVPLIALFADKGISVGTVLFGPLGVFVVLVAVAIYVYKNMGRFTPKGAHTHTHLLGLEEFIGRAKSDEIKRRLKRDPLYLEKLLPYAMLFDKADHWLSFYDLLDIKTPLWYHGNIHTMGSFDSSMSSAATTPSSSGGSGYSGGGGFSGGGGGGGGGGSW